MRDSITLECTECKQRNYVTSKNKKNTTDRVELKKYCKFCKKHTAHKETKQERKFKMATEANANVKKNGKLATYFKGVKVETKKVVWPTRKTLVSYTAVVIAVSIVISLITYLLDLGIGYLYKLVL